MPIPNSVLLGYIARKGGCRLAWIFGPASPFGSERIGTRTSIVSSGQAPSVESNNHPVEARVPLNYGVAMWGDGRVGPDGLSKFDRQFEPDGRKFLYRRNLVGRGTRVSKRERDDFVHAFNMEMVQLFIAVAILALLLFVSVGIGGIFIGEDEAVEVVAAVIILALSWIIWARRQAWNAPAKKLAGRPLVGVDRSRRDAWEIRSAQAGWEPVGTASCVVGIVPLVLVQDHSLQGWEWLWLGIFAVPAAGVAFWAWRTAQAMRAYREQNPFLHPKED